MVIWTDVFVKPLSRAGVRGAALAIGENVQAAEATMESVGICGQPHIDPGDFRFKTPGCRRCRVPAG